MDEGLVVVGYWNHDLPPSEDGLLHLKLISGQDRMATVLCLVLRPSNESVLRWHVKVDCKAHRQALAQCDGDPRWKETVSIIELHRAEEESQNSTTEVFDTGYPKG